MEIKKALEILNLSPDACIEDAKSSYRNLAKRYHPDRQVFEHNLSTGNDRMKDINAAFSILKNSLPSQKKIIKKSEKVSGKKQRRDDNLSPFIDFNIFLRKIYDAFFISPGKNKKKPPKIKKGKENRSFSKKSNRSKGTIFESVLNTNIRKSHHTIFSKSDGANKNHAFKKKTSYSQYMDLKYRMRSKRKNIRIEEAGPVEKISPISPVKKV